MSLTEFDTDAVDAIRQWYTTILTTSGSEGTTNANGEVRRSVIFARVAKKILKDVLDKIHPNLFNCLKYDNRWSSLDYLNITDAQILKAKRDAYVDCKITYSHSDDDSDDDLPLFSNEQISIAIDMLIRTVQALIRESDRQMLLPHVQTTFQFCEYTKDKIAEINAAIGNILFDTESIICRDEPATATEIITTKFTRDENKSNFLVITNADRCERRPYAQLVGNSTFIPDSLATLFLAYAKRVVGPSEITKVTYRGRSYVFLGEAHRQLGQVSEIYKGRPVEEKARQVITVVNWIRCVLTLLPDIPIDVLTEGTYKDVMSKATSATLSKMFDYFDVLSDSKTRYKSQILPNVRFHQWDIRRFDEEMSLKVDTTEFHVPYGRSKQPVGMSNEAKDIPRDRASYISDFLNRLEYVMRDLPAEEQEDIRAYTRTSTEWLRFLQDTNDTTSWWATLTDMYAVARMIRKFPGNNNGIVLVYGGANHTKNYIQFFDFLQRRSRSVDIRRHMVADPLYNNVYPPYDSGIRGEELSNLTNELFGGFSDEVRIKIHQITVALGDDVPVLKRLIGFNNTLWNDHSSMKKPRFEHPDIFDLRDIKLLPDTAMQRDLLVYWMHTRFDVLSKVYGTGRAEYVEIAKKELRSEFSDEHLFVLFPVEPVHPRYTTTWRALLEKMMNTRSTVTPDLIQARAVIQNMNDAYTRLLESPVHGDAFDESVTRIIVSSKVQLRALWERNTDDDIRNRILALYRLANVSLEPVSELLGSYKDDPMSPIVKIASDKRFVLSNRAKNSSFTEELDRILDPPEPLTLTDPTLTQVRARTIKLNDVLVKKINMATTDMSSLGKQMKDECKEIVADFTDIILSVLDDLDSQLNLYDRLVALISFLNSCPETTEAWLEAYRQHHDFPLLHFLPARLTTRISNRGRDELEQLEQLGRESSTFRDYKRRSVA